MDQKNPVEMAIFAYGLKAGLPDGRGAQKQIASALGISRQTVRNWCRSGSVSLPHVEKFARLTEARPEDLNRELRRFQR